MCDFLISPALPFDKALYGGAEKDNLWMDLRETVEGKNLEPSIF